MTTSSEHQWAVVAGATGSLGGAITKRLTEKGLKVLAVARNAEKLHALAATNQNIVPCPADLTDNSATDIIRAALTGPVKIVVQAIGLPIRPKNLAFDPSSMGKAINLKCGGLMRLTSALEDHLVEGSRIVALGGYHGFEPDPTATNPGATNAALANLVQQLSAIYGKRGVSVLLISPGPVDSQRIRDLADDAARINGVDAEVILDEWRNESTSGKLITLDQIAWAVGLLLEPESDCMHGSVFHIDGGRRKGIV